MKKRVIKVWRFSEAPKKYRKLSQHGGDEDWVALVPPHFDEIHISWLSGGAPFGLCDVSIHPIEDGYKIYIGAHA